MAVDKSVRKILDRQGERLQERRRAQETANRALAMAKRAIFMLHRGEGDMAEKEMAGAGTLLAEIKSQSKKYPSLMQEGAVRAALEESCEAILTYGYLSGEKITDKDLPTDDPEIVAGGLSDCVGELARHAVLLATEGKRDEVERLFIAGRDAVETLLQLDLTGHLREKFDQAKQHLRKLEEIRYDLSRRRP